MQPLILRGNKYLPDTIPASRSATKQQSNTISVSQQSNTIIAVSHQHNTISVSQDLLRLWWLGVLASGQQSQTLTDTWIYYWQKVLHTCKLPCPVIHSTHQFFLTSVGPVVWSFSTCLPALPAPPLSPFSFSSPSFPSSHQKTCVTANNFQIARQAVNASGLGAGVGAFGIASAFGIPCPSLRAASSRTSPFGPAFAAAFGIRRPSASSAFASPPACPLFSFHGKPFASAAFPGSSSSPGGPVWSSSGLPKAAGGPPT